VSRLSRAGLALSHCRSFDGSWQDGVTVERRPRELRFLAVNHPGMTSRGRRIAFVLGVVGALSLPKQVPCEVPGRACRDVRDDIGRLCTPTDLEPFGVYLIELVSHRDVRIAYRSGLECR
jgi:hypothetical protein